ncbi:MAG TPA: CDGSH iron-sulfur domain-containing protein [Hyphomicrobiaceae bacterium]|nr:CDGSH iron-sulfur domain-containing protein [Hyphomicrobiaceae bacterium]
MADEPVCAQKGPYQVTLEAGKAYFWCTCGLSQKQPYCDGAHKGGSFRPQRFEAKESGTFNLCGCKQSDDKPFCDGSHNML